MISYNRPWTTRKGRRNNKRRRFRAKQGWYKSPTAGRVFLQSNCERNFAKSLDFNKIAWIRPKLGVPYTDETGKLRTYFPDFYLTDLHIWVEIKWRHIDTDLLKIKALNQFTKEPVVMVEFSNPFQNELVKRNRISKLIASAKTREAPIRAG